LRIDNGAETPKLKRKNQATPSLFSDATEPTPDGAPASLAPAAVNEMQRTLAQRLPSMLYLGTSSWSFPGWSGLVYDRKASESTLARVGLESYAKHPLFRSVGVDKTFYRPAPRGEFERLAAQVPASFRFLVKMWRGVVEREPFTPSTAPSAFLDARVAEVECVRPAVEGLGEKAGPLLFQFPPMRLAGAGAAPASASSSPSSAPTSVRLRTSTA
jgi:hypothetical protein